MEKSKQKKFETLEFYTLGGSDTNDLQYARVPTITNADCSSKFTNFALTSCDGTTYLVNSVTSAMVCSAYLGRDFCNGDKGGPLVCNDGFDNAVIVGVISWGSCSADANNPSVSARLTPALSWIQNNLVMEF